MITFKKVPKKKTRAEVEAEEEAALIAGIERHENEQRSAEVIKQAKIDAIEKDVEQRGVGEVLYDILYDRNLYIARMNYLGE